MGDRRVKIDELVKTENGSRSFPLGITKIEGGIHICTAVQGTSCSLVIYQKGGIGEARKIPFSESSRIGDVWSMDLLGDRKSVV